METFVKLYEKKNPKKIQKTKTKEKNREFKTIIFICRSKVHKCSESLLSQAIILKLVQ